MNRLKITQLGIDLEHKALDKIHAALEKHPAGLRLGDIARATGLAIGYVAAILNKSTCVIRRVRRKWFVDWNDLPASFRPQRAARKSLTNTTACETRPRYEARRRSRQKSLPARSAGRRQGTRTAQARRIR